MIVAGLLDPLVGLLERAFQAIIDGLAALVNAVIAAWPIGMPALPEIPTAMLEVFQWFRWGPIGIVVDGSLALFLFMVTVWIAVAVAQPLLRFLKVWD